MLKAIEEELKQLNEIKLVIEKSNNYTASRKKVKKKSKKEARLKCIKNNGSFQYYIDNKYVRKENIDEVINIAKRDYYRKIIRDIEIIEPRLLELKEVYEKYRIDNEYNNLVVARKRLVEPVVKNVKMIIEEFENEEYEGKTFDEDDTTEYYTIKGERVRSKSEKIIADELFRYGIPYKYEMPIDLQLLRGTIKVYPDFTALNKRTGKKYIIEHFGMMDNQQYYDNAMLKLDTYERNDILLGDKLLVLHETSNQPLNTRNLDKYIEMYLC